MAVLFDLGGTLIDPKVGVVRSILHALDRMDEKVPEEGEVEWCVGQPPRASFARLLGTRDPARIEEAVRLFDRRLSQVGLHEHAVYPGVVEALERLREEGLPLYVATSKPRTLASRLLDRSELARFFDGVHGSGPDGRRLDKSEVIARLLLDERIAPGGAIMVGDREHDVLGARANGVACLGVTYGYGSPEELDEAGAAEICHRPEAIVPTILSMQRTLGLSCERR